MNKFTTIIVVIVLSGIGFVSASIINKVLVDKINPQNNLALANKSEEVAIVIPSPHNTTLAFTGDIMLARNVRKFTNEHLDGDFNRLFENLGELRDKDIWFTNLEGAVSDLGKNVGSIWSFRMNPNTISILKKAGIDVVSFANNHVGDWGMEAFKDTLKNLKEGDIPGIGAGMNKKEAEEPAIIEKNGIRFGFIGFSDVGPNWIKATDKNPGILLASDPKLPEIIKNAKANSDVLIVSFHFGEEYKKIHNKRQETLAHLAVDSGADMIIGHHPHVMEDIEFYKGHPIVYSLGNFIFDQYFSVDTMQGMLFEATFSGKNMISTNTRYIYLNKYYQPTGIYSTPDKNPCLKPKKSYIDQTYLDIGQTTSLPDKTYIPNNLGPIDGKYTTSGNYVCMDKETGRQFMTMITDAAKENQKIKITTAFRSYSLQSIFYKKDLKKSGSAKSKSVAKPGYSEHQLGTAVDITSAGIDYEHTAKKFKDSREYTWLKENAYKYGFIESYPEGKESITGYMYEPWHYRYVGIDNALEITKTNQTINEFLKAKKEAVLL